jgi:poly-gamma-glutamate synthesis protein (capsule biosynthesis protein)
MIIPRRRLAAVLLAAVVLGAGCSGGGALPTVEQPAPPPDGADVGSAPPPGEDAQPGDAQPGDAEEGTKAGEGGSPAQRPRTPLVVAVHATRPGPDLTSRQVRRLLRDGTPPAGLTTRPTQVLVAPGVNPPPGARRAGTAAATIAALHSDRDAIALLPAHRMNPTVRAARVDGVDPLRRPGRYPVTIAGPSPTTVVTVTVGGDVMADRRVGDQLARTGRFDLVLGSLARRMARADVTLVNLESTLTALGPPTQGIESFVADPRVRAGLREAGVDVVSLANNHSGDYGPASLLRTIELLRAGGFTVFGAGADAPAANRPAIVRHDGVSIAFVGFNAIGETPPAGPGTPGAASLSMPPRTGPLDTRRLEALTRQVGRLTERVDVVVVVPHWGDQYTAQPVPAQSRVGRALLAAGADAVIGGHPHWVQAIEHRGPRLLLHSLGNLVFDMDPLPTQEGVLAELVVWDDRVVALDLVPYVIDPVTWRPRPVARQGRGAPILQRMFDASAQPAFRSE